MHTRRALLLPTFAALLGAQDTTDPAKVARDRFLEGDYAAAAEAMGAALRQMPTGPARILAQSQLGQYYLRAGKLADAEAAVADAMRTAETSGDAIGLAIARRRIAEICLVWERKGDRQRARTLIDQAIQTLKGTGTEDEAGALQSLASIASTASDFNTADQHLTEALRIRRKLEGDRSAAAARTMTLLSTARTRQGNPKEGAQLMDQALAIYDEVLPPDHPDRAYALQRRSATLINQGDYREGDRLLAQALAIKLKKLGPDHFEIADIYYNSAVSMFHQNKTEESVRLFQLTADIRSKAFGVDHVKVARVLLQLALIQQEAEKYEQSEASYLRGISILEANDGPNHAGLLDPLHNLAVLYEVTRREDLAEARLQRCLQIIRGLKSEPQEELTSVVQLLAIVNWKKGRIPEAIRLFQDGETIQERGVEQVLAAGSETQKRAYLDRLRNLTNLLRSFHAYGAPNDPAALRMALLNVFRRKGRVLEAGMEDLSALRKRLDPAGRQLLDELWQVRNQRAQLGVSYLNAGGSHPNQSRIDELVARERSIEERISRRSGSDLTSYAQSVDVERAAKSLPVGSVLVEFSSFRPYNPMAATLPARLEPDRYAAYLLFPDREPGWLLLKTPAKEINDLANRYRAALGDPKTQQEAHQLGTKLHDALVAPVLAKTAGRTHLILSPDSALNLIPFAAIPQPGGDPLLARYEISYSASGREVLRWNAPALPATRAMLFADPDFGAPDPARAVQAKPLPGARQEAEKIAPLVDGEVLAGEKATKSKLKSLESPLVLHLATHGYFLDGDFRESLGRSIGLKGRKPAADVDPLLRSALLFAGANRTAAPGTDDGILTALEAASLSLTGTEMVVVSACESGLGDVNVGEGVYGLRRALAMAGARTQVISLWQVNDFSSRDLMIDFYRRLAAKATRSAALREAQLKMWRDAKTKSPYYWAAFIVSGNPGILDVTSKH